MNAAFSRSWRIGLFTGIALAGTAVFLLLPPLQQDESYHHFIDDRTMWGIPNCLNVLSNAPFALVGLMGLWFVGKRRAPHAAGGFLSAGERLSHAVFFLGAFLTCFGSAYYHWAPDDATLVWDRLPMTLAFMGLLAAVIGERIDARAGARLLWPLVIAGAATVWWWRRSGNLWPYAGAQFFSIVLIGLVLLLFAPRYTRSVDLLWVTGFYILAKAAEMLDRPVFLGTGFVSGHTLKHLIAALAVYWVLRMLQKRTALAAPAQSCEVQHGSGDNPN
jgi:xanthosine utilization system XapX-like protein